MNEKDRVIDFGALEYTFFKILHTISTEFRNFTNLNGLVGVIETTKAEFINRILQPYESLKLIDSWGNGKSNEG